MATLDPALFEGSNPFTLCRLKMIEKLQKTVDPFGARFLNEWLNANWGGGHIFSLTSRHPHDWDPDPKDTPALILYGSISPPMDPRGEGDRRIFYRLAVEGQIYSDDQEDGEEFLYRTLSACFFPHDQDPDPLTEVGQIAYYLPDSSIRLFPMNGKGGNHMFIFEFDILFALSGANLPWLRGM